MGGSRVDGFASCILGRRLAGVRSLSSVPTALRRWPVGAAASTKVLQELRRQYGEVWIDLRDADAVDGEQFVNAFLDAEPNRLDDATSALPFTRGHEATRYSRWSSLAPCENRADSAAPR